MDRGSKDRAPLQSKGKAPETNFTLYNLNWWTEWLRKRWFPSVKVLAANEMMEKPGNLQFSTSCGQFVFQLIMSPKGPDFPLSGVLLKLDVEVCITQLCRATHVWFKGRYWPEVHWLVFNQSEHCDGCELTLLSKPCKILLYTLSPQRCSNPNASRTELRESEWELWYVVFFSDVVLLCERLLLTALISLGSVSVGLTLFTLYLASGSVFWDSFPVICYQTVSSCGSVIG